MSMTMMMMVNVFVDVAADASNLKPARGYAVLCTLATIPVCQVSPRHLRVGSLCVVSESFLFHAVFSASLHVSLLVACRNLEKLVISIRHWLAENKRRKEKKLVQLDTKLGTTKFTSEQS